MVEDEGTKSSIEAPTSDESTSSSEAQPSFWSLTKLDIIRRYPWVRVYLMAVSIGLVAFQLSTEGELNSKAWFSMLVAVFLIVEWIVYRRRQTPTA